MNVRLWLLSAIWMMAVPMLGAAQPPSLMVGSVTIDKDNSVARVELANLGTRRAVAWSLTVTRIYDNGAKSFFEYDTDGYALLIDPSIAEQRGELIDSNSSRVQEIALNGQVGRTIIGVQVDVRAVVYEDRTVEGDFGRAQSFFDRRRQDYEAWHELTRRIPPPHAKAAGLRATIEELRATPTAEDPSSRARWLAQNLTRLLGEASATSDADVALSSGLSRLTELIRRYESLAQRHSIPVAQ